MVCILIEFLAVTDLFQQKNDSLVHATLVVQSMKQRRYYFGHLDNVRNRQIFSLCNQFTFLKFIDKIYFFCFLHKHYK